MVRVEGVPMSNSKKKLEKPVDHSEPLFDKKPKLVIDETKVLSPQPPPAPVSRLDVQSEHKGQYTRVEVIDPGLAKVLLEANVRNRPISAVHVRSLARDMAAGKFRLTHQGIALDVDGRLVDGQHRLSAIIESQTTQRMVVTYNVSPESFQAVDVNGQPRTIAQVVHLCRGTRSATNVVAAVKVLWLVLEQSEGQPIRHKWTQSEVSALLDVFEPDLAWASQLIGSQTKLLKQASVIAAFAYAAPVSREKIGALISTLRSRAAMSKTQAVYWRALERMGTVNNTNDKLDVLTVTLKMIMHELKGEPDQRSIFVKTDQHTQQPVYGYFRSRRKKLGLPT